MSDDIVKRLRSEAKTGNMPLGQSFDALVVADEIEARDAEIERLRAEVERLRAEVSRMDCTCLPYAEPHDGMCSRCMALRGPS